MWTSGEAEVYVDYSTGKRVIQATVRYINYEHGRVPSASQINPELANPNSQLRLQLKEVLAVGGRLRLGKKVRVLNGGGLLRIAGSYPLELGSASCSHNAVHDLLMEELRYYLGGNPVAMDIVAKRDGLAPFKRWRLEAGGVGRGDSELHSIDEFLFQRCINEMITEIGLLIDTEGTCGWVGYTFEGNARKELSPIVTRQWRAAHQHAPGAEPISILDLSLLPLPDTLIVEDWGWKGGQDHLDNVSISFELDNASLEVVIAAEGKFKDFPSDGRLRFIDLEEANSGALRRDIAVICVGPTGKRKIVPYIRDGRYNYKDLLWPLPLGDDLLEVATEKLATLIQQMTP